MVGVGAETVDVGTAITTPGPWKLGLYPVVRYLGGGGPEVDGPVGLPTSDRTHTHCILFKTGRGGKVVDDPSPVSPRRSPRVSGL